VEDPGYTNRFSDVHRKVKTFKDRLNQRNKVDAGLREDRLVEEAKNILDNSPKSSGRTGPLIASPDSV
jgi:hypothetical protein